MSIIKIRETAVKKLMVPVVGALLVVLLVSVFVSFGAYSPFGHDKGPMGSEGSNTAFVLNGKSYGAAVPLKQFEDFKERMRANNQPGGTVQWAGTKGQIIFTYIDHIILANAARDAGLKVSRREINDFSDKLLKDRLMEYRMAYYGKDAEKVSESKLDEDMRSRLGYGVDTIRLQVEDVYPRDYVEKSLLREKYEAMVRGKVQLSDTALRDSFRTIVVRHILIKTGTRPDASAKLRAAEVLEKLRKGEDFASLAREYSDDPGTAKAGGVLPPIDSNNASQYDKAFINASMRLKNPGDLSEPVKSQFGYHIIKLDSAKVEIPKDFDKQKEEYRKKQQYAQSQPIWDETANRLRTSAKIEFKEPEFEGYWYFMMAQLDTANSPKLLEKAAAAFQQDIVKSKQGVPADTSYVQLAAIRQMQGRLKDAATALAQGLQYFEDGQARITLARLYQGLGEKDKALEQYKLAAGVSSDPMVHYVLRNVFTKDFPNAALAKASEEIVQRYQQSQPGMNQLVPEQTKKPSQGGNPEGVPAKPATQKK